MLLMALLNVFFYLDETRHRAWKLSVLFVVLNIALTLLSNTFGQASMVTGSPIAWHCCVLPRHDAFEQGAG